MPVAEAAIAFGMPVRVYWEDTDAGGIVYHASYLRFMERARTEWLRAAGFEQDVLREAHGILFVVSRLAVDYLLPARFNDTLQVGVKMNRFGRASFELTQEVRRGAGELLCRAEVRVACLDAIRMRPCPIPPPLRSELQRDA